MTRSRSPLLSHLASRLHAADLSADDGGLVQYAGRLARRREGPRALSAEHLAPLASGYERALTAIQTADPDRVAPVLECHHAPVQHGKTTQIQAAVLRTLRHHPRAWIAYAAYNESTAVAKMYEVRQLCPGEGVRIDPSFDTGVEFRTREGGGVMAGGLVGGPWTSRGFDLIVIDDPYKTAQDAYSAAWRASVENAFWTALWTRRRPWTSILVNAARWHPHDLTGALVEKGWRYRRLPALDHEDRPLWPSRWPLSELLAIRDGRPARDGVEAIDPVPAKVWSSLYQGLPVPEGQAVFSPELWPTYDELPPGPYQEALGTDLAYGARARHDHSAHVAGRRYHADKRRIYIAEADDMAEAVELYACRLAEVQIRRAGGPRLVVPRRADDIERDWRPQLQAHPSARRIPCRWYTSTTEAGTAQLLRGYGAHVEAVRAAVDKLARVQAGGLASAAAEGRLLVPSRPSPGIVRMMKAAKDFTGVEGDFDDPVDALCAMHDVLAVPWVRLGDLAAGRLLGERAWGGERSA